MRKVDIFMNYFFVGIHNLQKMEILPECCISFMRLRNRKKKIRLNDWILDSGAFSQISQEGEYFFSVQQYADSIKYWADCGNLLAAVSQDYMCEPEILEKTKSTVHDHQMKTLERYYQLLNLVTDDIYLMPVLQGWHYEQYLQHLEEYDFPVNAWIGVGSICRRQKSKEVVRIIGEIRRARPDLRLHLFGAKSTALANPLLHSWVFSADSASWSYAARLEGRDRNSPHEALAFWKKIKEYDSGLFSFNKKGNRNEIK